ncbi:MAG: copper amine oxidase N-terminal domain-containing protein [Armatimonadota bacterium]|nr:copper amine oxidase N-terminal domain-containing protein [Armatimonadota bacterium]
MRYYWLTICVVLLVTCTICAACYGSGSGAASKAARIDFGGAEIVELDNGVILVPVKLFADWLCAAAAGSEPSNVTAEGGSQRGGLSMEVGGKTHTLNLSVGTKTATFDARQVRLDAAPIFLDNKIYAPLRSLSTLMGAKTSGTSQERTVTVTLNAVSGRVRLNSERIPQKYDYRVYKAVMARQETLGDRARKAGRLEEAENRYSTAIKVAKRIVSETLQKNPLVLLHRAQSSYLSGDYQGATSALQSYNNVTKTRSKGQLQHDKKCMAIGQQTERIRQRLEQKRESCLPAADI